MICNICNLENFKSRNELFRHIRIHQYDDTGASSASPTPNGNISETMASDGVPLKIPTLFEDDYIQIIIKPQGMPTMGCKGEKTVHNADELLLDPATTLHYTTSYKKAVPIHRLDRVTGGILICSKSRAVEIFLKYCMEKKFIQKTYLALCCGEISPLKGNILLDVDGKRSHTEYHVLQLTKSARFGHITTIELRPITGRRHQLRKHMHLIGHPILGESLYCHVDFSVSDPNLCLWSTQVILPHPQHFVSNDGSNVFKYDENMLSDRELFVEFRIQEPSRYEEIRRMHAEEWQRKQSEGKT